MRPGQGLAWIKEKMPICSIRLTCATFQTVMMRKLKTGNVISRFVFKLKARRSNKIWIKCKTDNFLYFIISVSSNGSWGYARVSGIAHESLRHAKIYIYICIYYVYLLYTDYKLLKLLLDRLDTSLVFIILDIFLLERSPFFLSCVCFKHFFILTIGHPSHLNIIISESICWRLGMAWKSLLPGKIGKIIFFVVNILFLGNPLTVFRGSASSIFLLQKMEFFFIISVSFDNSSKFQKNIH